MNEKKKTINYKIIIIMGIVFVIRLSLYNNSTLGSIAADSLSFIDYDLREAIRTPGYPLIIDLFQMLMPNSYLVGVAVFQIVISYIAVYYMYKALIEAMNFIGCFHENLALFFTLIFGCYPGIFLVDVLILAESLSMSITVFFIYYAICFINRRSVKDGIIMMIISLLGMLVKTALFVYTGDAIILLILMFILDKESRRNILRIGISVIAVVLFYGIWIFQVYKNTGVLSFSALPPRHDLVKCVQTGVYKSYPDKELVRNIDSIVSEGDIRDWSVSTPVMGIIGENAGAGNNVEVNQAVTEFNRVCVDTERRSYYRYLVENILFKQTVVVDLREVVKGDSICPKYDVWSCIIRALLIDIKIRVSIVCMSAFFVLILGILSGVFFRRFPYLHIGIFGGIESILLSVPIGTYDIGERTLCYVLPFFFMSLMIIVTELCRSEVSGRTIQ